MYKTLNTIINMLILATEIKYNVKTEEAVKLIENALIEEETLKVIYKTIDYIKEKEEK